MTEEEKKDNRPWYRWKTTIGSIALGLSVAIMSIPDIGIGSVEGARISTHMIGGCLSGIAIAFGGIGLASKLQKVANK